MRRLQWVVCPALACTPVTRLLLGAPLSIAVAVIIFVSSVSPRSLNHSRLTHHLLAPPRLDYSLPLPSPIDAAYPFAARLDSANAEAGPSTTVVRHVTPDEGFTTTLLNLDSEFGVHADVFWRMFRLCHSCNHIMTGNVIEDHICILN